MEGRQMGDSQALLSSRVVVLPLRVASGRRIMTERQQPSVDHAAASPKRCDPKASSQCLMSPNAQPPPPSGLITITTLLAIYHTAPKSTEVIKDKEKVV